MQSMEKNLQSNISKKNNEEVYIDIKSYLSLFKIGLYDGASATHRGKYRDFLEINDYFGVKRYGPDDIPDIYRGSKELYLDTADVDYLEFESRQFFEDFGYTEKEKVDRLLRETTDHPVTKKYLLTFPEQYKDNAYTPAYTDFVRIVLSADDVPFITNEDLVFMFEEAAVKRTKRFLNDFLTTVKKEEKGNVEFSDFSLKVSESEGGASNPAYTYDKWLSLGRILFNREYEKENRLTEKALENHKYAEMWLYLSLCYTCGWRSNNICSDWIYPNIRKNGKDFGINIDTLKEDILNDTINEKTYEEITAYSLQRLEMSCLTPRKTVSHNPSKLRAEISPVLKGFFGKLMLIAECHHLSIGEGYMKPERRSQYINWVSLRKFFGEDIFTEVTGKRNLSTIRLNKSFLQAVESGAKKEGYTSLTGMAVASFARNHKSFKTTFIYLRDHGLTGETADVVLYMAMQRGVMGAYLYNALITAFPDEFEKLPMKEQTQIMEMASISAYEIETAGTQMLSCKTMYDALANGKTEDPERILKIMYEVGLNRGKSKDKGIFCRKKALGYSCIHPEYISCIAEICPYHIFTREGIPTLLEVLHEYATKEDPTGRDKYRHLLEQRILPAFHSIINEILKEMSKDDKRGLIRLIEDSDILEGEEDSV